LQFAKFSSFLAPQRSLTVLPNPGFAEGEVLPTSRTDLLERLDHMAQGAVGDHPVVLLAVSSGGWVAHAFAEHLEARGAAVRGVALLDTYLPATITPVLLRAFQEAWLTLYPDLPRLDHELTAMFHYPRLFAGWQPQPLRSPTLFLQASRAFSPHLEVADSSWQARWPQACHLHAVDGDHFSMMDSHAKTTAEALEAWLSSLP
jgi:thioesterase domain-containing protein